jgi:hypothetical protein
MRINFQMKLVGIFTALFIFLAGTLASANTLFEGWFEIYRGTKKVGFLVERFEFVNNQFRVTKYLKTNAEGANITESLKAYSAPDLGPIKYAYTNKTGDDVKIIDANFKGDMMTLETFDGKTKSKQSKRFKKGTFLSEFLIYLILSQKDGLQVGKSYTYSAIAEEDGTVATGNSLVKDEETIKGKKVYRILNDFKGQKYFSWYTAKGEPVLNRSPEANMEVRLADSQAQATEGLVAKLNDLKLLFGSLPGESAAVSDAPVQVKDDVKGVKPDDADTTVEDADKASDKKLEDKKKKLFEKHSVKPSKSAGVPGGQGIEIKGAKPPTSNE